MCNSDKSRFQFNSDSGPTMFNSIPIPIPPKQILVRFSLQFNSDSNSTIPKKHWNPIPIPIPESELHIIDCDAGRQCTWWHLYYNLYYWYVYHLEIWGNGEGFWLHTTNSFLWYKISGAALSCTNIWYYPDRSGVYLQCHAVYTAATLQAMQCTCSIGQQVAVYLQCMCSLHCSYTETILLVHSTSVWVYSKYQSTYFLQY